MNRSRQRARAMASAERGARCRSIVGSWTPVVRCQLASSLFCRPTQRAALVCGKPNPMPCAAHSCDTTQSPMRSCAASTDTSSRARARVTACSPCLANTSAAVTASLVLQVALASEKWPTTRPIRVRMAIHTGQVEVRDGDYYGPTVNRCARLRALAKGGQVPISGVIAIQWQLVAGVCAHRPSQQ